MAEHPPWVAAFQNKLIGVLGTWSPDDKVAQRLMQVFLRAWTRKRNAGTMAANVAVFYQYAGAHEENAASQGLGTAGTKGVEQSNWCQQASTYAVCEALLRNGLRFKSPPGQENKERLGTSRINEVGKQAGRYEKWLNSDPKGRMAWGGDACFASALSPGDVVSFYSSAHGPTSTGHVVTLVTGAGPGEEAALTVVSGNAGGEAARVEEVQRVKPPAGLFSGSAKRPSGSKEVFIWSLQRSSLLNAVIGIANSDQQFSDAEIAGAGLERCKPLDEIWPASEAVPSTGSGGGATAPAGGGTPADGGATAPGGAAPGETPGAAGMPAPGASAPSAEPSVPAPAQPPEPASGGGYASGEPPAAGGGGWSSGGAQAPGEPTSAGDGGLGEWFESLWESVFSEPGTDAGPATGVGSTAGTAAGDSSSGGAATGSPGSEWFTDW